MSKTSEKFENFAHVITEMSIILRDMVDRVGVFEGKEKLSLKIAAGDYYKELGAHLLQAAYWSRVFRDYEDSKNGTQIDDEAH